MTVWVKRLLPVFCCITGIMFPSAVLRADVYEAGAEEESGYPQAQRFGGKEVMEAFALGYPGRVEQSGFRNGDWGVKVDGVWFLFAEGRLLPESVATDPGTNLAEYAPYPFYRYTKTLPPIRRLDDDARRRINERLASREKTPPYRHPGLFNAIWRMDSRQAAWERMKTTFFFGKKLLVHRDILEDLAGVEEEILDLAKTDAEVRSYVDSVASATGFNYRPIAGTASLSFHSYGFAIDLTPASYRGKEVYWRWAWDRNDEWFSLPYEKRYMIPERVVDIWERHGFVWGGKWFFFDSMHFEYRPEILLLNGIN